MNIVVVTMKIIIATMKIIILTMKTIDIPPTWSALIRPMMEVLKNPQATPESKRGIEEELIRLAKIVDE